MEPIDPQISPKKQSFFQWLTTGPWTQKKAMTLVAIILGALVIIGLSFWFGFKNQQGSIEPTPTPTVSTTPEISPSEEPSPTNSPTPTKKPTPTRTPTPTSTSTPTPTPTPQTVTISASNALDGWRSSNGGGNNTWDIQVGRNPSLVSRGFVSFPLSSIPSGATIENVTLRLYQNTVEGDPYGAGGDLKVDHLNYGDTLENPAYNATSLSYSFATLSNSSSAGWKEIEVTDRIREDRQASRGNSQYRLHFVTETTGGTNDFVHFESSENYLGTGNTPQLLVRYH